VITSYGELGEQHIDVLCEIGNIGAGNAATSLSVMIDEGVNISVPQVRLLDYDSVIRSVGDPEDLGIAIMIKYTGDVRGIVLFLLGYEDAKGFADILIQDAGSDSQEGLSEMMISTIKEIGNILGSSYLGSISTLTGLNYDISIPYVSIDMVGAIMSAPMLEFSVDNSKILMIEESFSTGTRSLKSHVVLFADIPSLNKILTTLGIEG
jgi:Chemotaxis protein CheC, inhibitor of MCP methylation